MTSGFGFGRMRLPTPPHQLNSLKYDLSSTQSLSPLVLADDQKPKQEETPTPTLSTFKHRVVSDSDAGTWQIEDIQLVGLLKRPDPVVYLSDDSPVMGKLNPLNVRTPDAFEMSSISELKKGKYLIVQQERDSIRMVGALRAFNEQCMACHDVKRDTLLGALSYRLKRAEP